MSLKSVALSALFFAQVGLSAHAQSPFEGGWTLSESGSNLHFISVKKGSVMESSSFATFGGAIDPSGAASFEVSLDSIDTSVDLRNVRMRFLLFETFLHPKATVTAQLDERAFDGIEDQGSVTMPLDFTLDLHGFKKALQANVIVTMMDNNRVSIVPEEPVILQLADFGLMAGRDKLQEAAEVSIVPATSVLFHLVFDRNSQTANRPVVASVGTDTALEPADRYDRVACEGRFEIISQSGNVNFLPGSSELTPDSTPLLEDVAKIIGKCPNMVVQIAGHTDSVGPDEFNLYLSQQRADSVVQYLTKAGVPSNRLVSRGFGEARPIASNGTTRGREANRRIEFVLERFLAQKS
ncbi:MAG: OmpA family protein [Pseudomonadota bacterium]